MSENALNKKTFSERSKIAGVFWFKPIDLEENLLFVLFFLSRSCGIEVVKHLDAKEYGEFLKERAIIEEQQKKELQEKKEAKLLRAG